MEKISSSLVGMKFDPIDFSWTAKDVMLYALGVGAKPEDELEYVFEGKGPKVLPTYGVIPGMLGMGRSNERFSNRSERVIPSPGRTGGGGCAVWPGVSTRGALTSRRCR